jgi:acyl-[acyl-carrier-protein]-phospholipid O-acyltransferase/long-chain-fatty-acid--[acyl-carrier-protein] ligase
MQPSHKRSLRGLLIAQFFGALNDNAWKLIVALLGIRSVAALVGGSGPVFQEASQAQTTLAFGVFTLALMLVSVPGGALVGQVSKRSVIILMRALEVILIATAMEAFLLESSGVLLSRPVSAMRVG